VREPPEPPFDPLIDPDLAGLWLALDATDNGTTLSVPDRGAGGYTLTATGTRAQIDATGVAGLQGLDFSALVAGNGPLTSAAFGAAMVGGNQATVLALVTSTPTTGSYLLRYGAGGGGDWYARAHVTSPGQLNGAMVAGATCDLRSPLRSVILHAPKVVAVQFDGSLAVNQVAGVWQNGKNAGGAYATNGSAPASFANRTLYVCSNTNASLPFTGRWGGMAIVKRLLTATEIAQWSAWMRAQYSLGAPKQVLWVGDSLVGAAAGHRLYIVNAYNAERGGASPWGTYDQIGPAGLGTAYPEDWHDGVSGSTITTIGTRMATTLAAGSAYDPDIVALSNCGTNDVLANASAATIASRWETLLTTIYDLRPNVKIKLISLINHTSSEPRTQVVIDANLLGPTAVANAIAARPGMLAEWVDGPYAITLADGTHPTTGAGGGYDTMGTALWPIVKAWS
jgi:hypothetical protein